MVATACAFLFPIGPLIYLSFRSKLRLSSPQAPASFCSRCGHNSTSKQTTCPKCGNELLL
ncbi:hypothetical protein DID74_00955 [Candidatus Marinamargulisbacteria bacterium SCGC AG-333-B06]|nr:hypothetical protein DID74_00955 [Candidatus Marinamargulisbacteria bacterium SCGC AG-333-B06]